MRQNVFSPFDRREVSCRIVCVCVKEARAAFPYFSLKMLFVHPLRGFCCLSICSFLLQTVVYSDFITLEYVVCIIAFQSRAFCSYSRMCLIMHYTQSVNLFIRSSSSFFMIFICFTSLIKREKENNYPLRDHLEIVRLFGSIFLVFLQRIKKR